MLPNVGPAPAIGIEATPARLARGKYLALYVAGCNNCHSTRDYSRYSGPVTESSTGRGGEVFRLPEGRIVAPNISPLNLGSWTDGEIYRAITTGVGRDGRPLFPLMPYANFSRLDREDVYSIIAYIRTWAPEPGGKEKTQLDFPMNVIVHTIPKKADPGVKPDSNDLIAYGRYMVTAASCRNCHSPMQRGNFVRKRGLAPGQRKSLSAGSRPPATAALRIR